MFDLSWEELSFLIAINLYGFSFLSLFHFFHIACMYRSKWSIFSTRYFFMGTLHPGKDRENATVSPNSVSTSLDIVPAFFNRSIVSIRLRVV